MQEVKSVLFVTYHFPPEVGGIQTRISNYCCCLAKFGIAVKVFFFSARPNTSETYSFNGAEVVALSGGARRIFANAIHIVSTAVLRRADVIHVFTGASTLEGVLALITARILGASSTFSIFGREDFQFRSELSRLAFKLSATIATSITANSFATKNLLSRRYRSKTKVLLGGANAPEATGNPSETFDKRILFVGRLVRRKGLDDLLTAFSHIKKSVPGSSLVIVGEGAEKEEIRKKSRDLGVEVELRGGLFGKELSREYALCSVCVLPSKQVEDDSASEGLGLSLIEASMHGKPIIGTLHGGIPEVVKDGVNGFLVPEADPLRLGDAILKLLTNDRLRLEMGRRARDIAMSNFTWEGATKRLLESYG